MRKGSPWVGSHTTRASWGTCTLGLSLTKHVLARNVHFSRFHFEYHIQPRLLHSVSLMHPPYCPFLASILKPGCMPYAGIDVAIYSRLFLTREPEVMYHTFTTLAGSAVE